MKIKFMNAGIIYMNISICLTTYSQTGTVFKQWGEETLTKIEQDYRIPGSNLYYENTDHNAISFHWPAGVQLHALIAAGKTAQAESFANEIHAKYWCFQNNIWGYNSSANSCGDRYYDDNAWVAKANMELYKATNNITYLNRAKDIIAFSMSGEIPSPGGEIKFHEGDNNTCLCATGPAMVTNLMIYQATNTQKYLNDGLRLYNYVKANRFGFGPGYRGYENALITQAAILLFKITGNTVYRDDARHIGLEMESAYVDAQTHALREYGQWGGHDMTNAYVELYQLDGDVYWLNIVAGYLKFLHDNCKDANGRYPQIWDQAGAPGDRFLLYQAGAARAYAKMGTTPGGNTKITEPLIVFKDCNYTGWWNKGFMIGRYTLNDLIFNGAFGKDISSIKIQPGFKVTFYENPDLTGASIVKTSDVFCLVNDGWNDRIQSMEVEVTNPGVIVYKDCNYQGRAVYLPAGSFTLSQLQARGINNDEISSLKVSGDYVIEAFENDNFSGAMTSYTANTDCLVAGGWNDRITSIRIRSLSDAVVLYSDCSYGGVGIGFKKGDYDMNALVAAGIANDVVSSLQVAGGYEVVAYQDWDFTGTSYLLNSNYSCLASSAIDNWISSIRVRLKSGQDTAVNLYLDCNYAGSNAALPVGNYDMNALVARGIPNDAISSMKVNDGYEVIAYQDWDFTGTSNSLSGSIPCLSINNIDNSISSIKVKARSPENTSSDISNRLVHKVPEPESINEHTALLLFPNPVVDQLNLQGIDKIKCLKVYNVQGKEVFSVKNPGQSVNMQSIPRGLYIVVVENEKNKLFRKKFLKK